MLRLVNSRFFKTYIIIYFILGCYGTFANEVKMNFVSKNDLSKNVGTIIITETKFGLLFTPNLIGAAPGVHGFHIHNNPDCSDNGMAAGGHFDPEKTNKHLGPYGKGHLGDLPALYAAGDGSISLPVLAPRLKSLTEIKNHALMVHTGSDNYSDYPTTLGGGGGRMICGIIE